MSYHPDDTKGRRFLSFWLGIAMFFVFAIASAVVAFVGLRSHDGDPSLDSGDLETKRLGILEAVEKEQAELVSSYGWSDQGKKLVRVPTGKAIELAVAKLSGNKGFATEKVIPGTETALEIFAKEQAAKKAAAAAEEAKGDKKDDGGKVEKIVIKAVPNVMQFDKKAIEVTAGVTVQLTFENPDLLQHNFVLCAVGAKQTVGNAANAMMTQPDAMQKHYVPEVPEVLFGSELVNPNASLEMTFQAPNVPGEYPYLCTFPGHWMIMNGVLTVVPAK